MQPGNGCRDRDAEAEFLFNECSEIGADDNDFDGRLQRGRHRITSSNDGESTPEHADEKHGR